MICRLICCRDNPIAKECLALFGGKFTKNDIICEIRLQRTLDNPDKGGLNQFCELFTVIAAHARLAFFQELLSRGEFIVTQISLVMLIFLFFSDQISGGELPEKGAGKLSQERGAPRGRKPG